MMTTNPLMNLEGRYQKRRESLAKQSAYIYVDDYYVEFKRLSKWGASHNLDTHQGQMNELLDSWLETAASMDRQLNNKLIQIRAELKKSLLDKKLRDQIQVLNINIDEIYKIKERNARVTKFIRCLSERKVPEEEFKNNFILKIY